MTLRRLVARLICCLTDWLERIPYRENDPGLRRWVGERAQVAWFRAHNNRLYGWALGMDSASPLSPTDADRERLLNVGRKAPYEPKPERVIPADSTSSDEDGS